MAGISEDSRPAYLDLIERYNEAVNALHWAVYGLRSALISIVDSQAEDLPQLLRAHFEDGITALHREYADAHGEFAMHCEESASRFLAWLTDGAHYAWCTNAAGDVSEVVQLVDAPNPFEDNDHDQETVA
ncbi:hypothetical protein ACGFKZ_12885 [Micromonospora tulbaghiae]|uniref:hypothetical protein n=1 Tax=Micromonospora tulbaghiae TaxID=479978 RepID=UPI00371ABF14